MTRTRSPHLSNPRRRDRWLNIVVLALVPASAMALGTVHQPPRLLVGAAAAALGVWVLLSTRHLGPLPGAHLLVVAVGALALAGSALTLLPSPPLLRKALQPGLAPVEDVLVLAGASWRPLALDPRGALAEWVLLAGLCLLVIGFSRTFQSPRRGRRTAVALVGTGASLVLLTAAQEATGATSILWVSGVPEEPRERFFGTFVNPNHAGIFLAAVLPLAVALLFRARGMLAVAVAGGALILVAGGVWVTGSRGAVLAALAALTSLYLLWSSTRGRVVTLFLIILLVAAALAAGFDRLGAAFTAAVSPDTMEIVDQGYSDLYTGRPALYRDTVALIGGTWPLGVGLGGFEDAIRLVKSDPGYRLAWHAHQEILHTASEVGVPTTVLWLAALGLLIAGAFPTARADPRPEVRMLTAAFLASAVAIFTACLYDFPLRIGAVAVLAAVVLGALMGMGTDRAAPGPTAGTRLVRMLAVLIGSSTLLALGGLGLAGATAHPWYGSAARTMEAGDEALRVSTSESLADARRRYLRALRQLPVNRPVLQRLSRLERASGGPDASARALSALDLAVALEPTLPWAWIERARLLRGLGRHDEANASWRRALWCNLPAGDEDLEDSLVLEALMGPGDPAALAEDVLPARSDRLISAARHLGEMGYHEQALALLREAANDGTAMARLHLASHLIETGDPEGALGIAREHTDRCWGASVTARALSMINHHDESVDAWRHALTQCGGGHDEVRRSLTMARLAASHPGAQGSVERILRKSPLDHVLRRSLIESYRLQGSRFQVMRHLDALSEHGVATAAEREESESLRQGGPMGGGRQAEPPTEPTGAGLD